jgi:hypothetical protein
VLPDQKEWAVVEMVRARIDIRLSEIKQAIEENDDTFANVASFSLPDNLPPFDEEPGIYEPHLPGRDCVICGSVGAVC